MRAIPTDRSMRGSMAHSETHATAPTVSVIVLAFNEEGNLSGAVETVRWVLEGRFPQCEIIIVNDGSRDNTGKMAEALAEKNPRIKAVHNPQNMGCAFTFRRGVQEATCEYVWLIPGDSEITAGSMEAIAKHIGTVDIVIPFVTNFHTRPLSRRIISWGYTTLLNVLFLKRIRYYNGPCVIRRELIEIAPTFKSRDFTFMAPILLSLIRRKHSFVQVGIELQPRRYGKPSFRSVQSILNAGKMALWLFWNVHLTDPAQRFRTRLIHAKEM